MSTKTNRPLSTAILAADQDAVVGLINLVGFKPVNTSLNADALKALLADRTSKEDAYTLALNAYRAAADARALAQHTLHNRVLQLRSAVVAQYGLDSDEVVAVGMKKKSERKPATRRTLAPAPVV